ncbi:glycosyl hydrolase family 28-related protein [Pontiellaceae bacterium B12227]|nr:glycosyl hydrolase family 28-related protein [Pontiellaceae bacterium B12227]
MKNIHYNIISESSLLFFVILIGFGVFLSSALADTLYPDIPINGPTDQFPGFPEFHPPVDDDLSIDPDAPQIAEWTRQSAPGDTMILTGENLSIHSGIAEGRDSRFIFFGEGKSEADALIQRLDGQECAITLPWSLPADTLYLVWPHNENGFGEPVAINRAEAWWIGLDQVSRGDSFSVYGQNLVIGDGSCYLYIVGHGWIVSEGGNPYKADFTVPSNLANGTYTCYAHNGHGRKYGWSQARTFTVQDKLVWDDDPDTWTDVTDYGAKGDGVADDAVAINKAYDAIKNRSAKTLYFPAGTYLMGSRLFINGSGSVRIKGDGMGSTIIKPSKLIHPYKMINVRSDHTRFEDLTVETGGFGNNLNYQPLFNVESCSDIRFTRLQLMQTNATSQVENHFRALKADHLYFEDCEFYAARSTWFESSEDIIIKRCVWKGVHDSNNLLGMETSRAAVFDCTAKMLNSSDSSDGDGWAKGRWIAGGVRGWNNFYVGSSTTVDMVPRVSTPFYSGVPTGMGADILYNGNSSDSKQHVWRRTLNFNGLTRPNVEVNTLKINIPNPVTGRGRGYKVVSYDQASGEVIFQFLGWEAAYIPEALPFNCTLSDVVDQNSSEQIMFEGGNTSFRGAVSASSANSVTLPGYAAYPESATYGYITIVDGRGLGQTRQIYSNNGDQIFINEDWQVIPDTSSRIVVGRFCHRFVVYGNNLDSVPSTSYSASVGFQITGSGHSVVVDGNTISQTRSAMSLFSESQAYFNDVNIVNPIFFGLYQNNAWSENKHGISLIFGNRPGVADPYPSDKCFIGNVFRNNTVSEIEETGFLITAEVNDHVGLSVLENSQFTRVTHGVSETDNSSGLICLGNSFSGKGDGIGFNMSSDNAPVLHNNVWSSFATIYGGTPSGAYLNLPKRLILLSDSVSSAEVEIRNGGTASLTWDVETSSSWLSLSRSGETVEDEADSEKLHIALIAEPEIGSQAIITVTGGGYTKQITVVYGDDVVVPEATYIFQLFGFGERSLRAEVYEVQTERTFYIEGLEGLDWLVIPSEKLTAGYEYMWKLQEEYGSDWIDVPGESRRKFRHE